ncbi:conserved hypothetical protein [Burkholderiales bacterium 8X]|nr:conserved hypothetical protein [Burkholderiales bacterium 8X]
MSNENDVRFVGMPMQRREDARLLTGGGQYVADMSLPGMLHVAFVRSSVAHGRIVKVDLSRASAVPGVHFVLAGAELAQALPPVSDQQLPLPAKWRTAVAHRIFDPRQPLLAVDKVRHVGEAIAVIVAESRYIAEDALDLVDVEIEELPAVVDPEAALAPGSALIHEQNGTNLLAEFAVEKGSVKDALARAPRRIKRRFHHHRYAAMPMECRGILAQHDRRTDVITIWSSTQMVHWVQREVATTLGLPEANVRCVAPDVGGGFGGKGHVYPEDILMSYLAHRLRRPVKWIEDRREHLQSACHSRDQLHDIEIGFDEQGRILAMHDSFYMDCGAWNPVGVGIPYNTASHLIGPYEVPHFGVTARVVTTNKVPNAPYRGAGRPEAVQAVERMMDIIAGELGLDPVELRMRNLITPEHMPYSVGIPYRDGEPVVYDGGDYPKGLQLAVEAIGGLAHFRRRQQEALARGSHLGLGLAVYTEGTGVGPFEGATVRIERTGKVYVTTGACSQGQGMETVYAQLAADMWKVAPEDVVVVLGDTSSIAMGFGTIASRSTVNVSAAMHHASERLVAKTLALAANMHECSVHDLELRRGGVGLIGVPGSEISLGKLAQAARPGWDNKLPAGMDAGLEDTYYWEPPTVTWAYGAHAAVCEVDIETGRIDIVDYAISHDCGVVVNPLLADGQIIGGVVQGIGGALLESFHYDENGQLLTGSFMDYLLPTADAIPHIKIKHQETPSPLNPVGVKGLGEGGAIGPPVAIANAVCDALRPFRVEFNTTPITPEQVVRACGVLPAVATKAKAAA